MDRKSQNRLIQHGLTLLEVRGKQLLQRTSSSGEWHVRSTHISQSSAQREADRLVGTYLNFIKL